MKKQGFRLTDETGVGFERWSNDKTFIIPEKQAINMPICIRQIFIVQCTLGFEVAKNYCKLKKFKFTELSENDYPTFWKKILNKHWL